MHERRSFYASVTDNIVCGDVNVVDVEEAQVRREPNLRDVVKLVRRFFVLSPEAARKMAVHAAEIFQQNSAGGAERVRSKVRENQQCSTRTGRDGKRRTVTNGMERNADVDVETATSAQSLSAGEMHRTRLFEHAGGEDKRTLFQTLSEKPAPREAKRNSKQRIFQIYRRNKNRTCARQTDDGDVVAVFDNRLHRRKLSRQGSLQKHVPKTLLCCGASRQETKAVGGG